MSKEGIIDTVKIVIFMLSWAAFTATFFPFGGLLWENASSNGFALLLCFMLTAWYETLSGLGNYEEQKEIRKLNIFEVSFGIIVIVTGFMFFLAKRETLISVTGIICSFVYLFIKTIRLGKRFQKYIEE